MKKDILYAAHSPYENRNLPVVNRMWNTNRVAFSYSCVCCGVAGGLHVRTVEYQQLDIVFHLHCMSMCLG